MWRHTQRAAVRGPASTMATLSYFAIPLSNTAVVTVAAAAKVTDNANDDWQRLDKLYRDANGHCDGDGEGAQRRLNRSCTSDGDGSGVGSTATSTVCYCDGEADGDGDGSSDGDGAAPPAGAPPSAAALRSTAGGT